MLCWWLKPTDTFPLLFWSSRQNVISYEVVSHIFLHFFLPHWQMIKVLMQNINHMFDIMTLSWNSTENRPRNILHIRSSTTVFELSFEANQTDWGPSEPEWIITEQTKMYMCQVMRHNQPCNQNQRSVNLSDRFLNQSDRSNFSQWLSDGLALFRTLSLSLQHVNTKLSNKKLY